MALTPVTIGGLVGPSPIAPSPLHKTFHFYAAYPGGANHAPQWPWERRWDTRLGTLRLQVPKLREGGYDVQHTNSRDVERQNRRISGIFEVEFAAMRFRRSLKPYQSR